MCTVILKIFLIVLLSISYSSSAKILAIFPIPSISHQLYFRTLTTELMKRGHEITVLTTDPAYSNETAPKNIREFDFHDMSYKLWENFLEIPLGDSNYLPIQLHNAYETLSKTFENQLKTDAVKNLLQNEDEIFDLLVYDGCLLAPIIFSYIYKIPAIAINSLGAIHGNYETIGAVVNDAYYPANMCSTNAKTPVERLQEAFKYYYNIFQIQWYIEKIQSKAVNNALGADMPDIRELKKNINMMFINLYSAWDSHRPAPISLKYMGGLHSVLYKPLPEDIKSYLDSSTNGVIYMSFGTNVKSSKLTQEKIKTFTKVFSRLPYDVLWKWDVDTMPNKPKNVKLFKWLPQTTVLKHPKIKLFISQGGLQSSDEAITAGVPLIGIPMLGDQWFNTEKYVRYNIGVQLDFWTLTEESFMNSIENVIGNQSYYNNIIRHDKLMRDQPHKPLDQAVRWIEYIIKHGGSHLQAPAADISWAEYVELELLVIITVCIGSVIAGLCYAVNFVIRILYNCLCKATN